jgi:hypothetical protein
LLRGRLEAGSIVDSDDGDVDPQVESTHPRIICDAWQAEGRVERSDRVRVRACGNV